MSVGKIGFCCKWTGTKDDESLMNSKTTTISCLSRMTNSQVINKLYALTLHNIESAKALVSRVATFPDYQKLVRLGSDLLPCYTHEVANWAYDQPVIREVYEKGFAEIGEIARKAGVRLSFHPGQYCVLNSLNPGAQQRAIEEFEYHVMMMQLMGYGDGWHPHGASVNVHVGSREGSIQGFMAGLSKLSPEARNLITIENDEICFGLDDLEPLAEHVAIVFDIHHEWVYSGGQYIQPDDPRLSYVRDSWRGVRPLGHYSVSGEGIMTGHDVNALPCFTTLRSNKKTIRDIRSHSDGCWNNVANDWALTHLSWMDIEVEAKLKNIASQQLVDRAIQTGVIIP